MFDVLDLIKFLKVWVKVWYFIGFLLNVGIWGCGSLFLFWLIVSIFMILVCCSCNVFCCFCNLVLMLKVVLCVMGILGYIGWMLLIGLVVWGCVYLGVLGFNVVWFIIGGDLIFFFLWNIFFDLMGFKFIECEDCFVIVVSVCFFVIVFVILVFKFKCDFFCFKWNFCFFKIWCFFNIDFLVFNLVICVVFLVLVIMREDVWFVCELVWFVCFEVFEVLEGVFILV